MFNISLTIDRQNNYYPGIGGIYGVRYEKMTMNGIRLINSSATAIIILSSL